MGIANHQKNMNSYLKGKNSMPYNDVE